MEEQPDRLAEIGDLHALMRIVTTIAVAHEEHGAGNACLGEGGGVVPRTYQEALEAMAEKAGLKPSKND